MAIAGRTTRRSLLARAGAVLVGVMAGGAAAEAAGRRGPVVVPGSNPIPGGWYGFCGHTYTTGSCDSPFGLPRIDRAGRPLRPSDGRPVDDLGRLVDASGHPVDERGHPLLGPDGQPLGAAPRTRLCEDWVPERHQVQAGLGGAWYRCCGGQIRKLVDCCSFTSRRINGDAALTGYCHGGRNVYCVTYHDTGHPC
jgi:hypothetical protein